MGLQSQVKVKEHVEAVVHTACMYDEVIIQGNNEVHFMRVKESR